MITTMSSSNPAAKRRLPDLFVSILRRNTGVTVLYAILLFIFFPLQYILTAADASARGGPDSSNYFSGSGGIFNGVSALLFPCLMMAIPVIYTMLQYTYLHQKKATDMYHALPVARHKLLLINYVASCAMILVPLFICYGVTIAAGFFFALPSFQPALALLGMLVVTTCTLATLSFATLAAAMTGTMFDNFLYTCGTLFALPVTLLAIQQFFEDSLFGFVTGEWIRSLLMVSPATTLFYLNDVFGEFNVRAGYGKMTSLFTTAALVWLVLAAAVLLLAIFAYRRRKSELAGKTGYNNALTLTLKALGSLVGGAFFSLLIRSVYPDGDNAVVNTATAVVGSALAWCVAECVLSRGFKTLRGSLPFIAGSAVLTGGLTLVICTGGLGYEARVPAVDSVQSVDITYSDRYAFSRYDVGMIRELREMHEQRDPLYAYDYYGNSQGNNDINLTQAPSRQLIHDLHKQVIADEKTGKEGAYSNNSFGVTYHLENGTSMSRSYHGVMIGEASELYSRLNGCEDVKRQTHPIFSMSAADVREVALMSRLMTGITPVSLTEEQVSALIEALRADMLTETYDQMETSTPLGYIVLAPRQGNNFFAFGNLMREDVVFPDTKMLFDDCYVLLTDHYTATLDLLREYGYAGFDAIDYSKITAVYAKLDSYWGRDGSTQLNGPQHFTLDGYKEENSLFMTGEGRNATEFTSPADIRVLLDQVCANSDDARIRLQFTDEEALFTTGWSDSAILRVAIVTSDGSNLAGWLPINPKSVPETLLRKLEPKFSNEWDNRRGQDGNMLFETLLRAIRDWDGDAASASDDNASSGVTVTVMQNPAQ